MKIIKSFFLFAICLTATSVLQAQDVKVEAKKATEMKAAPPATTITSIPSPASELKPMNGVVPKASTDAVAETPSPSNKEKDKKQPEDLKLKLVTRDANSDTKNLTPEQINTSKGIREAKKPIAPAVVKEQ